MLLLKGHTNSKQILGAAVWLLAGGRRREMGWQQKEGVLKKDARFLLSQK